MEYYVSLNIFMLKKLIQIQNKNITVSKTDITINYDFVVTVTIIFIKNF